MTNPTTSLIHLADLAKGWAHRHHASTLRRQEGIGAYAAAELGYPLAAEWPTSPAVPYLSARAAGMEVVTARAAVRGGSAPFSPLAY